jgi:hypothetical protein
MDMVNLEFAQWTDPYAIEFIVGTKIDRGFYSHLSKLACVRRSKAV